MFCCASAAAKRYTQFSLDSAGDVPLRSSRRNICRSWAKKHTQRPNAVVVSVVTLGLPITVCIGCAFAVCQCACLLVHMMVMLHLQPGTAALGCLYMLPQGCLQRGSTLLSTPMHCGPLSGAASKRRSGTKPTHVLKGVFRCLPNLARSILTFQCSLVIPFGV